MYNLQLISTLVAKKLGNSIPGLPVENKVLVYSPKEINTTAFGIIIPDTAKEKPLQGEVVAIGNGTKDEEMVLHVGDQVLYGKYSGTELEHDGKKYLIMRQSDVLAVLG